ncbi:hypothetical protein [Antrihabitans spumae]|uniref:Uncharacterized protein n=1 Tax=Antrihabitans spumae TaxID=3373370 RepID=A0ABW7KPJ1_9NOCA
MSTPDHPDDPRGPGEPRRSEPVNGPAAGPLPQRGHRIVLPLNL